MSPKPQPKAVAEVARSETNARRAAGYCGEWHPTGRAFCTRPPHTDRRHVDHYNGKKSVTDAEGTVWTS